jgi:hypothetical protein
MSFIVVAIRKKRRRGMGDDDAGFSVESLGGKGGTQQNPSKNVFSHAF